MEEAKTGTQGWSLKQKSRGLLLIGYSQGQVPLSPSCPGVALPGPPAQGWHFPQWGRSSSINRQGREVSQICPQASLMKATLQLRLPPFRCIKLTAGISPHTNPILISLSLRWKITPRALHHCCKQEERSRGITTKTLPVIKTEDGQVHYLKWYSICPEQNASSCII